MLAILVLLAGGYLVYGRLVARTLGVDPERPTPAHTHRDGVDFVPARHWLVLFGHHFSSICGAGPIVGPALAVAYWGWAPSVLWILVGSIFLGAVSDFAALVVSVRHEGRSIADVSGSVVSRRARLLFSVFIWVALVLVIAVFTNLAVGTFTQKPRIVIPSLAIIPGAVLAGLIMSRLRGRAAVPVATAVGLGILVLGVVAGVLFPVSLPDLGGLTAARSWTLLFLAYCAIASVTPVQHLLQPRDYLASYLLFGAIAAATVGVFVSRPVMQAEPFHAFRPEDWSGAGPLWPMMFVTIACGAVSGFHTLVSSGTTCKQLDSEGHACRIGYGGMLAEGLVAGIVVICVGAGLSASRHGELLHQAGGAILAFGEGFGNITGSLLGGYGGLFAVMALNAFILTTLDSATRIGRYLTAELFGLSGRWLPTLLVVGASGALAWTGQWRRIWPAFGASNQLVGALALLVVSCWLLQHRRLARVTAIPALLILVTTVAAFVHQIRISLLRTDEAGASQPDWFLAGVQGLLVVLAAIVLLEAARIVRVLYRARDAVADEAEG
jgi:carbon starvation protein